MKRRLTNLEKKWINTILRKDFKGKEILIKQLENIYIDYEQGYDYISLKFVLIKNMMK